MNLTGRDGLGVALTMRLRGGILVRQLNGYRLLGRLLLRTALHQCVC